MQPTRLAIRKRFAVPKILTMNEKGIGRGSSLDFGLAFALLLRATSTASSYAIEYTKRNVSWYKEDDFLESTSTALLSQSLKNWLRPFV